jgi:hypothetical protein
VVSSPPDPAQLLTALTTEHFTLQGARAQTVNETSARASMYMLSLSSALVALGFVSQAADDAFTAFALVVLPTVHVLGCATYVRLVECSGEDLTYGIAINRIRSYYIELAGDRADLFLLGGHDDAAGVFRNMGIDPDKRSHAFAFSTAIAIVNAVVGGSVVALALAALAQPPIGVAVAAGVVSAAASVLGWTRYATRILTTAAGASTPISPTPRHRTEDPNRAEPHT